MRRNAIYQGLLPRGSEVDQLLMFVYGLNLIPKLKREFPALLDIGFVPGTFGAHMIMAMENVDRGEIRRAVTMALTFPNIKKAIIVDGDVDINNPLDVEWAMATRFQADRDLVVVPELKGQPIDPSCNPDPAMGFLTTKMGIDATKPATRGFEKIGFPEDVQSRMPSMINDLKKGT
jgi:2,5-furandicarboxylate decarboxylase 1